MEKKNKTIFDKILLGGIVIFFLLLFSANVSLLYKQNEIKKVFAYFLQRDPSKEEVAHWIRDQDELSEFLIASPEREEKIKTMFFSALNREVNRDEKKQYRETSLQKIADETYQSEERKNLITTQYAYYLGRSASESELAFFVANRSNIKDIQKTLNGSKERMNAIQKTYRDTIGREPTLGELGKEIVNENSILWIRVIGLKEK